MQTPPNEQQLNPWANLGDPSVGPVTGAFHQSNTEPPKVSLEDLAMKHLPEATGEGQPSSQSPLMSDPSFRYQQQPEQAPVQSFTLEPQAQTIPSNLSAPNTFNIKPPKPLDYQPQLPGNQDATQGNFMLPENNRVNRVGGIDPSRYDPFIYTLQDSRQPQANNPIPFEPVSSYPVFQPIQPPQSAAQRSEIPGPTNNVQQFNRNGVNGVTDRVQTNVPQNKLVPTNVIKTWKTQKTDPTNAENIQVLQRTLKEARNKRGDKM